MTKSDLVKKVSEANALSTSRAEKLVDRVFDSIQEALQREERVEIRALGSFEIRHYGSYDGRNPRTGAPVAVRPKRLPFFRAAKELRDLFNLKLTRTQDMPTIRETNRRSSSKAAIRSA